MYVIWTAGAWKMAEAEGSEQFYPAQLVLLALGFLGPETAVVKDLSLEQDARGNIKANTVDYRTSIDGIFACGDARRGQSLIVWVSQCSCKLSEAEVTKSVSLLRVSKKDELLPLRLTLT
jgi:NADPH-dependent glutamate synthase beta subunit-like oxidoreductase